MTGDTDPEHLAYQSGGEVRKEFRPHGCIQGNFATSYAVARVANVISLQNRCSASLAQHVCSPLERPLCPCLFPPEIPLFAVDVQRLHCLVYQAR